MALAPTFVTRTIQVEATKGLKELVSRSFIARFANGTEKVVNSKKWQQIGLLRECDKGYRLMSLDNCPLYWCDWSKLPTFSKVFPEPLIPQDIFN